MSRTPRPHYRRSPSGDQPGQLAKLDYIKSEYHDFLSLARTLASEDVGMQIPNEQGNLAETLLEIPALLAHILGSYQDLYASEAFLSTAISSKNLVRHARRLAYEPDAGLSATGFEALTIKDGLSGRIPKGFAFASSPFGEQKTQTFETLADLDVDAQWNAMLPLQAKLATIISFSYDGTDSLSELPVEGVGHNIDIGSRVVLHGQGHTIALRVNLTTEYPENNETKFDVVAPNQDLSSLLFTAFDEVLGGYRIYIEPASSLNVYGWNKDTNTFHLASPAPFTTLQPLTDTDDKGDDEYGYVVNGSSVTLGGELFLSSIVTDPLQGQLILIDNEGDLSAYAVTAENSVNVSYHYEVVDSVDVKEVTEASGVCSINPVTHKFVVASAITDTVTAVTLQSSDTTEPKNWTTFPIHARVFAHWLTALTVSATRPNPAAATGQATLSASLKGMRPGRHLILSNLDERKMVAVNITRYDSHTESSGTIYWQATGDSWTLGDLKVLGNIARISHGETVTEVLGDSNGVSSFQRYPLKKLPVTQTPGADRGELNLEVCVNDVAWAEVNDFHDAKAEDRVYIIERDEDQAITVIFGGGGKGAVPPAGKKNVTASYRIGLGRDGNVDAGRVSRVKKASPILDYALNTHPISGGAAPADPEDIRSQATRYIRTFERAVSVSDYADLALLFPGVVRASAQWANNTGVQLTVATAEGIELEARDALRAYLDQHRDITVPLTFVPPEPVAIQVTAELFSDPAYLTENVKLASQDMLYLDEPDQPPGRFTFAAQQLGQAAFLSQLYDVLSDVEGVVRVRIVTFDIKPSSTLIEPELRDVIRVTASQWLSLDPSDCDISVVAASDDDIASVSGGGL